MQFSEFHLSSSVLAALKSLNYITPTPVQEAAIPLALQGHDIIACAQTGTGKTAAFCLPCFTNLCTADTSKSPEKSDSEHFDLDSSSSSDSCNNADSCSTLDPLQGPYFVVVTPTRELADQISQVCNQIAEYTKHRVITVVGGVSYNLQKEELLQGCHVLIATPGRLEDLLEQEALSLANVKMLVLDEADRMLDIGFKPSVLRIAKECNPNRQTLLFSATINPEVKEIAKRLLHNPQSIEVSRGGQAAETIDQYLVRISHAAKPSALKAILNQYGTKRVIIFARTKYRVDACVKRIKKMGFNADSLHSEKSQAARREALASFAQGKTDILVATDVLSRGIDIDNVNYVINFDLPDQPEDYVHRIGRTGRAGNKGFTVSLVAPENEEVLSRIIKLTGKDIPAIRLKNFDIEAVEFEAGARSAQLQARRANDPEVEAVIKELAAKERKERKKQNSQNNRKDTGNNNSKKNSSKKSSAQFVPASPSSKKNAGKNSGNTSAKNGRPAKKRSSGGQTAGRPKSKSGTTLFKGNAKPKKKR